MIKFWTRPAVKYSSFSCSFLEKIESTSETLRDIFFLACLMCLLTQVATSTHLITAGKRSLRRLCFYTFLSVILFRGGGVSASVHAGIHPPWEILGNTGNKWTVRILLECILVWIKIRTCFSRLLPFGAGRLVCAGEVLAKNRLFLIMSGIVQNFTFKPKSEAEKPDHDPRHYGTGFVIQPRNYEVCAVPR